MFKVLISLLPIAIVTTVNALGQEAEIDALQQAKSVSQVVQSALDALMKPAPQTRSLLEQKREAVARQRRATGPDSPELIPLLADVADLESKVNERAKVIATRREALRIAEKNFGPMDYRTLESRVEVQAAERVEKLSESQFVELQRARARLMAAQFSGNAIRNSDKARLAAEAHEAMRTLSGVGSKDCENAHKLRGTLELAAGHRQEVVRLIARDIAEIKEKLGPDNPDYVKLLLVRSLTQSKSKDFVGAESGLREADRLLAKSPASDLSQRFDVLVGLSSLLIQTERLDEAEETTKLLVELAERSLPVDRLKLATALDMQASVAQQQHKDGFAIQCMVRAAEIESSPEGRPLRLALLHQRLGICHFKAKRWDEAEPLLKSSALIFTRLAGPGDPRALRSESLLADLYVKTERWTEAEALLKPVYLLTVARTGRDSEESRRIRDARVTTLRALGQLEEADELLREPRPFLAQPPAAFPR